MILSPVRQGIFLPRILPEDCNSKCRGNLWKFLFIFAGSPFTAPAPFFERQRAFERIGKSFVTVKCLWAEK
jgi:hypothetical protein